MHHQYDDKYFLVERGTCIAMASQLNCLAALGLTVEQLRTLKSWAAQRSVSLRFKSKETCAYLREETRQEEDPRKHVEEVSHRGVAVSSWTSKVVTTITEWFSSISRCSFLFTTFCLKFHWPVMQVFLPGISGDLK